jgi:hypothetical protein
MFILHIPESNLLFMAKERLCGFKVGEVVQLQVEIELFGKEKAPKYTVKNVYKPSENTKECEYDLQQNEITKPHVKENELSQRA